MALVKLTHPGVAQPHSLTDPLLSLFDNNPNLQAIVLQLHDSDARAVVEHVKKSCGGPNRGMSLYLREWEMQDGSPGIHVSGDVAAGWRKWECKAQQVQRGHWEDTAPLYSLQPTGCMGKRVTLKYPCSSSNPKRENAVTKKSKSPKKTDEKEQLSVSNNAFQIGGTFEVRSHSTLLPIIYRDFKGSGA